MYTFLAISNQLSSNAPDPSSHPSSDPFSASYESSAVRSVRAACPPPVEYCLELILARVHELRKAMVAAHEAVIASLTQPRFSSGTNGQPPTRAVKDLAPYSSVWRLQMDGIEVDWFRLAYLVHPVSRFFLGSS